MNTWQTIPLLICLTACSILPENLPSIQITETRVEKPAAFEQFPVTGGSDKEAAGYMTFVINVHDWVNIDDSADTLLHLIDIYEEYGVKGDFYFTAPVVEAYAASRPDVIDRLKTSGMTISYHIRAPHPSYNGFDERLQGLDQQELHEILLDYETYHLDLATGDLDRNRPGGYRYVAEIFGTNPVVAPSPNHDRTIKETSQKIYADLGAQMTVLYHENGTDIDEPFQYINGLLIRPSDFSITRIPEGENFWWNFMNGPHSLEYDPATMLQEQLEDWNEARAPFITSLIHENNFYRSGPTSWTPFYYSSSEKSTPISPPFDMDATDTSKPRSEAEKKAIWEAYERMVAYAAANLAVITSIDIAEMARQ
ncbi:MAG: hypothetical protein AB9891_20805 [Anaerolineaceae bacterium]